LIISSLLGNSFTPLLRVFRNTQLLMTGLALASQAPANGSALTRTYFNLTGLGWAAAPPWITLISTVLSTEHRANGDMLGDGADTFTIAHEPAGNGLTLSTAGGNDTVNIKDIEGPATIYAGRG